MATFGISQHCVPQLHLKGLFSSSLWTLCTLAIIATFASTVYLSCTWKGCSPVLCGLCVLYYCNLCKHCVPQLHLKGLFSSSLWTLCTLLLQPLQALCTSAAPERTVNLQFSVHSIQCILQRLSQHCVPQLYLNGLFSSSLWTLWTLLLQPLQVLCTSAAPESCSPVLCGLCVLYIAKVITALCTSAAPEWAVLQCSVDSVYSIIATFASTVAPERAVLQFSVYCKGYHSTVYLSCTWMGCSPVLCGLCVIYYCNLCKHRVPQLHVLKGCSPVLYGLCVLYTAKVITALCTYVAQLHLKGCSPVLCGLCGLYTAKVITALWTLCTTSAAPEREELCHATLCCTALVCSLSGSGRAGCSLHVVACEGKEVTDMRPSCKRHYLRCAHYGGVLGAQGAHWRGLWEKESHWWGDHRRTGEQPLRCSWAT